MDDWVVRISGVSASTVGNRRYYRWVATGEGFGGGLFGFVWTGIGWVGDKIFIFFSKKKFLPVSRFETSSL